MPTNSPAYSATNPGSEGWTTQRAGRDGQTQYVPVTFAGGDASSASVFSVATYGAVGNAQDAYTGAMTSGSAVLTISAGVNGGSFSASDVGKVVWVRGAAAAGGDLLTTIASYTSSTQVTLAAAAATTVSSAGVVWGTDDTAAIQAAVNAAHAYALSGPMSATVLFDAKYYLVSSPTTKNATTKGNAQIYLPYVDPNVNEKVVLTLQGVSDASAWNHWLQPRPQMSGTVIRSVLSGLALDGTYGAPSVIGGPSTMAGAGNGYSNMLARIDGITVMAPPNPSLIGVDLYGCAMASIGTLTCLAAAAVPVGSTNPRLNVTPTNDLGIGLRLPSLGNNDNVTIESYGVEGFYYGLACADHTTAQRVGIIYSNTGIYIYGSGALDHGLSILNLSIEGASVAIQGAISSGGKFPLHIPRLDMEGVSTLIIDSNNGFVGELHYQSNNGAQLPATGATNLRIVNNSRLRGNVAAPGIPASTTDLLNPFQRDAAVTITGGTVTAVAVDGVATGITSGTVVVPTQKNIRLTYSAAPSWTWTLL